MDFNTFILAQGGKDTTSQPGDVAKGILAAQLAHTGHAFQQASGAVSACFPFPSLISAANLFGSIQLYGFESIGYLPSPLALEGNIPSISFGSANNGKTRIVNR